jgi:uncharacterized membrane protein
MDDNPQQTPIETPTPGPAPVTPPMGAPIAGYPRPGMGVMASQEEKGQATLVWVLSIFFGFIPSLIFFLIAKDKPFVHRHAAMALTVTIVCTIGWIIGVVLTAVLIGLLIFPVVGIYALVVCITVSYKHIRSHET